MLLRTSPMRMSRQERARMLLDAIRTLRTQPSLRPEQRRRGIHALQKAYLRELREPDGQAVAKLKPVSANEAEARQRQRS